MLKEKSFSQSGFSLIELMIVVAIVAILAVIAYPSYTQYAQRSNRSDAKVALTEVTQRLERCYTSFNAYNADDCRAFSQLKDGATMSSESGFYTITGSFEDDGQSFTVTATASRAPQTSDEGCETVELDNTGVRTPAACW